MRMLSLLIMISLMSCGGEWVSSPDSAGVTHCSSESLPAGRSVLRGALSPDGSSLYVLDNWSTIYRFQRHPVRSCGWEPDFEWQNAGSWSQPGFVQDLDYAVGLFAFQDGASISVSNGWECRAQSGPMALGPDGQSFLVATQGGIQGWVRSGSSCVKSSFSGSGFPVWVVAQESQRLFAIEGVGLFQNFVVFDLSGSVLWREPLSVQLGDPKYFCSADRLRSGPSGVFLLDKECQQLGVFERNGVWRKTLDLGALGIRRAIDIMPGEQGMLYILTENQQELTVRLSSLLL